jgi:hypothetical protein
MVFKVDHFMHSILHTYFGCHSNSLIASFIKLQPPPNVLACFHTTSKIHLHHHCKKLTCIYFKILLNIKKVKATNSNDISSFLMELKIWNLNYHHKYSTHCIISHCCILFALYLSYFSYLI